ncbi:hypothetical protein MUK42_12632 [Musa troglodytarum]|uniref:Uncharacterized protein n=1 Tax=Musa troglodytarum TaxID=320322 RepID=A0A9E7KH95_9LILI|nr:hypothetical protein MUK42_12632 [Musa troglodytarum]
MVERGEKGCVVSRGGVDGIDKVGVAPDVGNNTRNVEGIRTLHHKD